jgi:murein DD-endopeptidase MepM/ murein hydrolase activator NlpD
VRTLAALQCIAFLSASSQTITLSPDKPRQGQAIHVEVAGDAAVKARMNGRTVPLYRQADGTSFALMPVPVLEKPGTYRLEILNGSGEVLHSTPVPVADARFQKQNIRLSPGLSKIQPAPGEMETVRDFRALVTDVRYWHEPFALPVPGCMTSPFGVLRFHNGKPTGGFHGGIDQRGPAGQPIQAITGGVVKVAQMFNLHGGTVGLDHGQGLLSIYLHMSKLAVKEGIQVEEGDVIGYVGSTGRSTAPHLHWALYANGVPVTPLQWVDVGPCAPAAKASKRKSRK